VTATVEHLAPAVPLHRAPRRPRTAQPPADLHAQLTAGLDRLLETAESTEMTSYDALGGLVGALINAFPPGGRPLSKHGLVDLVVRVADGLGCPAALTPELQRHEQVGRLVQALADYPSPFQAAVRAASAYRESGVTADFDLLWSAAEDLHDELDVQVVA
jgi:hypothetical protein